MQTILNFDIEPARHNNFLESVVSYFFYGKKINMPHEIMESVMYLHSVGVKKIAMIGVCWGSCFVQQILSTGLKRF